jgi:hypothetical protein
MSLKYKDSSNQSFVPFLIYECDSNKHGPTSLLAVPLTSQIHNPHGTWSPFPSFLLWTNGTQLAQSCTPTNARAIDTDGVFIAYWEIIEVSWLAIADVKKRSLMSSLDKRDLVCASTEECLSFKGDAFCYDKS